MEKNRCPHCRQLVMVRRRNLRKEQIFTLRIAANHFAFKPFKVSSIPDITRAVGGDFTILKHWGLIEEVPGKEMWTVTHLGATFLLGQVSIPKYCWIFNDTVQSKPLSAPNPEVFVYEICRDEWASRVSTESIRKNSMTFSEYQSQNERDLFK